MLYREHSRLPRGCRRLDRAAHARAITPRCVSRQACRNRFRNRGLHGRSPLSTGPICLHLHQEDRNCQGDVRLRTPSQQGSRCKLPLFRPIRPNVSLSRITPGQNISLYCMNDSFPCILKGGILLGIQDIVYLYIFLWICNLPLSTDFVRKSRQNDTFICKKFWHDPAKQAGKNNFFRDQANRRHGRF